jgi:hypothetical protein
LLQEPLDPRVDPSAKNNEAFRMAVQIGHTEIAKRLLQDPRCKAVSTPN